MPKYLHIQVNSPCQENWDTMLPGATGNFCNSCQKTVVDFTAMTDNQLLEYFKKTPANSCGRFYTDQLEQSLQLPVKRIPWVKYFLTVSLPALLLTYKGQAQRLTRKSLQPVEVMRSAKPIPELTTGLTVTGRITGENGQPVPYASVIIVGTEKGMAADSNGVFTLRITGADSLLEVSAVGYKKQEVAITAAFTNVQLQIAGSENITLNTITCTSRRSITMGGYMSVVSITRRLAPDTIAATPAATLELFPNPAKRTGRVSIRFKKPVSNNQQLIIYNAAGIRMQQQMIYTKQPLPQVSIDLRLAAGGYYILHIVDEKTHETQSGKLIVQ